MMAVAMCRAEGPAFCEAVSLRPGSAKGRRERYWRTSKRNKA